MAKYEKITIANVEEVIKTGYIEEIICDGDKKEIYMSEGVQLKLQEAIKPVVNAFAEIYAKLCGIVQPVIKTICDFSRQLFNKKLTKKKFMKLLQSQGIQRNEIKEIVKNNKEPYTYLRYYNTIEKQHRNKKR